MSAAKPSLQTWVPRETKKRFTALATRRGMSESKLLALLVDAVLEQNPNPKTPAVVEVDADAEPVKYTVRLRAQDGAQIDARAKGREMRPATYLALLVRAHVRQSPPLPIAEMNALKRAVAALNAVGRNLNQIALASHRGESISAALRDVITKLMPAVQGVRETVKLQLAANARSWESGES